MDGGGEFRNHNMKEKVASKYDLKLYVTTGHSSWSNEANERNHFTVDKTVEILLEEDQDMSLE